MGRWAFVRKGEMMSTRRHVLPAVVAVALLLGSSGIPAAPRTFVPDYTFSGSALT
jgi:hypothetical protein